jgi:hypothetical protein
VIALIRDNIVKYFQKSSCWRRLGKKEGKRPQRTVYPIMELLYLFWSEAKAQEKI